HHAGLRHGETGKTGTGTVRYRNRGTARERGLRDSMGVTTRATAMISPPEPACPPIEGPRGIRRFFQGRTLDASGRQRLMAPSGEQRFALRQFDLPALSGVLRVCEVDMVLLGGGQPRAVLGSMFHDGAVLCAGEYGFPF